MVAPRTQTRGGRASAPARHRASTPRCAFPGYRKRPRRTSGQAQRREMSRSDDLGARHRANPVFTEVIARPGRRSGERVGTGGTHTCTALVPTETPCDLPVVPPASLRPPSSCPRCLPWPPRAARRLPDQGGRRPLDRRAADVVAGGPVEDRLQPWLAAELAQGGTSPLPVMVSGETTTPPAHGGAQPAGLRRRSRSGTRSASSSPRAPRRRSPPSSRSPGVRDVSGDQPMAYTLDTAAQGHPQRRGAGDYKAGDGTRVDGSGVSVAIIDSGIDGTHPFFQKDGKSKVVRNMKNVCGVVLEESLAERASRTCRPTTPTRVGGGHGTHVAGIVAGYEATTTAPAGATCAAPPPARSSSACPSERPSACSTPPRRSTGSSSTSASPAPPLTSRTGRSTPPARRSARRTTPTDRRRPPRTASPSTRPTPR